MKKELILKIMDEKIKLGWDFERTFQYLCEVEEKLAEKKQNENCNLLQSQYDRANNRKSKDKTC